MWGDSEGFTSDGSRAMGSMSIAVFLCLGIGIMIMYQRLCYLVALSIKMHNARHPNGVLSGVGWIKDEVIGLLEYAGNSHRYFRLGTSS